MRCNHVVNPVGIWVVPAVLFSFKLMTIVSSSCKMAPFERFIGEACPWDDQSDIMRVSQHECHLGCVYSSKCKAFNYDTENGLCMKMHKPCPVVEPQISIYYQILVEQPVDCWKWVLPITPRDWDNPRLVKINKFNDDDGNYKLAVSRFEKSGNLYPAYWPDNEAKSYTIDRTGRQVPGQNVPVSNATFEVLLINDHCSMRWVNHPFVFPRPPIPDGAVEGGRLADGKVLHMIRVNDNNKHVIGYFHAEFGGVCNMDGLLFTSLLDFLVPV